MNTAQLIIELSKADPDMLVTLQLAIANQSSQLRSHTPDHPNLRAWGFIIQKAIDFKEEEAKQYVEYSEATEEDWKRELGI